MRERESLFNEYLIEVRRREKEEKSQRREQVRHYCFFQVNNETKWYEIDVVSLVTLSP